MKKPLVIIPAVLMATCLVASAHAETITKGLQKDIPSPTWVDVAQTISNTNDTFYAPNDGENTDHTCLFLPAGRVLVVGVDKRFSVLLKYTLPPGMTSVAGTPCPSGTLTFMDSADVSALPAAGAVGEQMLDDGDAEAAAVHRLLNSN
jgi:hypothetical protein